MKAIADIIIKPLITEKATDALADKRYVFKVQKSATKPEIARAVEEMFDVKEATISLPGQAKLFDSYVCDCCGEVTGSNWIRLAGDKKLCLDCYECYDRFHI